jgi:chromate transporter
MPAKLPVPSVAGLFWSFLRLGATSFGGPSMVAYIRRMAVEQKHWLEEDSFLAGVALCQVIPGATAMQTSAYVGLRTRGFIGAVASFTGFGLPAYVFMMVLSTLYTRAHSLPAVVSVFQGLQAVIVAIVANATLTFGRASLKSWRAVAIGVVAAAIFGLGLNPLMAVLCASVLGILLDIQPFKTRRTPDSPKIPHYWPVLISVAALSAIGYLFLFFLRRPLFELAGLMTIVDLSAFGGGFASLPLMFHEIVDVRAWLDGPTFLNGVVLGQVTPGPIVITATFVGNLLHGPVGGLIATIAVFLPSFLLVVATTPHFNRLLASGRFTMAVGGILCSFVGLLLTVTVRFALNVPWDLGRTLLACAAFVALVLKVDILWVVLAGVIISLVVFLAP